MAISTSSIGLTSKRMRVTGRSMENTVTAAIEATTATAMSTFDPLQTMFYVSVGPPFSLLPTNPTSVVQKILRFIQGCLECLMSTTTELFTTKTLRKLDRIEFTTTLALSMACRCPRRQFCSGTWSRRRRRLHRGLWRYRRRALRHRSPERSCSAGKRKSQQESQRERERERESSYLSPVARP